MLHQHAAAIHCVQVHLIRLGGATAAAACFLVPTHGCAAANAAPVRLDRAGAVVAGPPHTVPRPKLPVGALDEERRGQLVVHGRRHGFSRRCPPRP